MANLKYNSREFRKTNPKQIREQTVPIYKEVAYYDKNGQEIYKISSIDKNLKDILIKKNTYIKAENYFSQSQNLKKGRYMSLKS